MAKEQDRAPGAHDPDIIAFYGERIEGTGLYIRRCRENQCKSPTLTYGTLSKSRTDFS